MRTLATVLLLSSISGAAAAQTAADWAGPYAGVAFSAQAESDENSKTLLEWARDPRLTYVAPPSGRGFENPPLEPAVSPVMFAGWRHGAGSVVLGVEGRLQYGGPSTDFSNSTYFSGSVTQNCGPASIGCLFGQNDTVAADIDIKGSAALRFSMGMPVGDHLLISAFAGPAVTWGNLSLTQTSEIRTGRMLSSALGECITTCSIPRELSRITVVESRSVDDTALGFTLGMTFDLKVTDRLSVRAEGAYSRFEALGGSPGGVDGAESNVWVRQAGFTGGLGFSVRF